MVEGVVGGTAPADTLAKQLQDAKLQVSMCEIG